MASIIFLGTVRHMLLRMMQNMLFLVMVIMAEAEEVETEVEGVEVKETVVGVEEMEAEEVVTRMEMEPTMISPKIVKESPILKFQILVLVTPQ